MAPAQCAAIAAYRPIEEHVPAHWREHTVEANGIRQHYWRTGTGGDKPALILLHGTMGNGLTWSRLARDLDRAKLAEITHEIGVADVIGEAAKILAGQVRGRIVVKIS